MPYSDTSTARLHRAMSRVGEIPSALNPRAARPRGTESPTPSAPPRPVPSTPPASIAADLPRAVAAARQLSAQVKAELDWLLDLAGVPAGSHHDFLFLNAITDDGFAPIKGRGDVRPRRSGRDMRAAFERSAPWPVIGWGNFRVALRSPDGLVVKLPYTPLSGEDNPKEAERWHDSTPRVARHMAPVLAADPGGEWLVMPFVPGLADGEDEARGYRSAAKILKSAGIDDITDAVQNWGKYDGRYVARDYAA